MLEIHSQSIELSKDNTSIHKNINLDADLDCFLLLSSKDAKLCDIIFNNMLDLIIDKISPDSVYNDFSIALENINALIRTWKLDNDAEVNIDIVIGVLHKNNLIFSNIGKASCSLLKSNKEVVELTESGDSKTEFSFISNGTIGEGEIIIMSSNRLLNHISESDLVDGLNNSSTIEHFNANIHTILSSENLKANAIVTSFRYSSFIPVNSNNKILGYAQAFGNKIIDSKASKVSLAYLLQGKDKLLHQDKKTKNILFISGIVICLISLYFVISTLATISTNDTKLTTAKENIVKAKNHLQIASDNIGNEHVFSLSLENITTILEDIETQGVFLSDVAKIKDDLATLKKQFNKIELFKTTESNTIYSSDLTNAVKVVKNNLKTYIINEKSITGPIIPGESPKTYTLNSLESGEKFIHAAPIGTNMYILTNFGKIVRFTKSGNLDYVDVQGQSTWDKAKEIKSYAQNLYLLSDEKNQIIKHAKYGNSFKAGQPYLKNEDEIQIGEILSTAIDGGFYILKKDLSFIKFFSSPKYRIEKLLLNQLPNNYEIDPESKGGIELKTRPDLNYVYLLLNNKIWIFKPNSKSYANTQSLTYVGQIEGDSETINDFYINYDGEILVMSDTGVYKLTFEISDDSLILR